MSYLSPKVSIIIPHYNMNAGLTEAVESVKELDYKNIELIIVDDGSDERQFAGIREQLSDEGEIEIKLLRIVHAGKPTAVNCGFKEASGAYIAILDADDQMPQKSLSRRVKALEVNNADLCVGSFEIRYDEKTKGRREISKISNKGGYELSSILLTKIISPFHQNSMMFSSELLAKVGGMNPRMIRGQDKDFAISLLRESTKTVFVDESVYIYNKYNRPLSTRLHNRLLGTKFKLIIVGRFFKGMERLAWLSWVAFISTLKMLYDVFGVYKK